MRAIQAGCIVMLAVFLSGFDLGCLFKPSSARLLDFKAYAQRTETWCWAASGQMTMNHIRPGTVHSQCEAVNDRVGRDDCCTTRPSECLVTSDLPPLFEIHGFDFTATSGDINNTSAEERALPWEEIKRQIHCRQKPFAFSWWLAASLYMSGHFMVAIGYTEIDGQRFVDFIDPLPPVDAEGPIPQDGRLVTLTYEEYVENNEHIHGTAFFDINPKGEE